MVTLTETAYYTRRVINWLILGVVLYILLRIFWSIFAAVWLAFFPPKPPLPNHGFGKLPALKFTQAATPSAQLTFRLETIEGSVPRASESATVYFMPKASANLLALTRAQDFAERFEFSPTPIQESKNIYRFQDPENPLRRMRYDLVSNNFVIRYGFEEDAGLFSERNLPTSQALEAEVKSLLQTVDLYPEELASGEVQTTLLRFSEGKLVPVLSRSQADAIRVDFFRWPIGEMKLVTPNPDEGTVSFVFSGSSNSKKRLLQFAYTFWPIEYQTTATYSLKSSQQAWQDLQNNKGSIARYPRKGSSAVVRNSMLAYYDSFDPQNYLQPIFVFEGDDGFVGYVHAISPEWVE